MAKKLNTTPRSRSPQSAEEAYAAVQPEIEDYPEDALLPINVDIPSACAVALGAADLVEPLRKDLASLNGFDEKSVAKLRTYALAALYANAVFTASLQDRSLKVLLDEAVPLRAGLLVAAEALAHRGLVSAARVAEIRTGQGHHDTADDLIALAALFKEGWASVEEKTAVTREEFERAAVLGTQLHAALGARQVGAEGRTGSQELWKARQRAFSLFVRAYDECRRGVVFLRWHEGDADRYVPSIYRKRRRAVVVEEEGTEVTPELDEAPATEAEVPVDVLGDSPIAAGEIFETT